MKSISSDRMKIPVVCSAKLTLLKYSAQIRKGKKFNVG